MAGDTSTLVLIWWGVLVIASAGNVCGCLLPSSRRDGRDRSRQRLLSGVFVAVCAFRSILPRVDGRRFCLYDSWLSSAFIGRSAATLAELCLVAQWTLVLGRCARAAHGG